MNLWKRSNPFTPVAASRPALLPALKTLSTLRGCAAVVATLSCAALLGTAKPAQAGSWVYNYAGTGKLSLSGGYPLYGLPTHAWQFNQYIDYGFSDFNPAFSLGDGTFANDYIAFEKFTYSYGATATQSTTIDSSATPSIPIVTVTATWVPAPTTDVNNDGFINALDDPAPISAPTPTLRVFGDIETHSGGRLGPYSSARSQVKIKASYRVGGGSGTWYSVSTKSIDSPGFPTYASDFNDGDSVDMTASADSYSAGVATYTIRVDEFNLYWDGTTAAGYAGAAYSGGIKLIFP